MNRVELARRMVDVALLRGDFKLRSGGTSNVYFDKYQFEAQPKLLRAIAQSLAVVLARKGEVLAGLELGGVPIATALSLETGLPTAFVRKARKQYGTCRLAEGAKVAGKKVVIVEDVVTTGSAVFEAVEELRREGATVETVLCAIYRGDSSMQQFTAEGLKLFPLYTISALEHLTEVEIIPREAVITQASALLCGLLGEPATWKRLADSCGVSEPLVLAWAEGKERPDPVSKAVLERDYNIPVRSWASKGRKDSKVEV